jgi:hypothetical protein
MNEPLLPERLREAAAAWTPPAALRLQVLGVAAPLVRSAVSWSDRVWFSRRWRVAVAAVVVAVIALDFASPTPGGAGSSEPPQSAGETAQAVNEAARQAGLEPDQARVFAQRALALASRPVPVEGIGSLPGLAAERGDAR